MQKLGKILTLLLLLASAFWLGTVITDRQTIQSNLIRLHVIANSDTQEDQALKLQVRDRVLERATELLEQSSDMLDAQVRLENALPAIETAAQEEIFAQGYSYTVSARLEQTEFPTKFYDGFSLPSGEYLALRVVIGEGAGENWWCVVYPPLCMTAATDLQETALTMGMCEEDISLMTEETAGYVLKFRSVELWESFRQWLQKM